MNIEDLIKLALEQCENAYAPYSKFSVGCALITKNGNVFTGANVENASSPLGCCAERVAIFNAITNGEKDIETIAIANTSEYPYPCGACRQVMAEFNKNMKVIVAKGVDDFQEFTLNELLPYSFELKK